MSLWKKVSAVTGMIAAISLTGMTVLAANANVTPAEAISKLTGRTVKEVMDERNAGTPYGVIAEDAGVLEEFQQEMYDSRAAWFQQQVEEGRMSEQAAETALSVLAERHAACEEAGNCTWGDGSCVWGISDGICVLGHENGTCAWTDEEGHCLWGHDSGACTWVDGTGNCLAGHDNGACIWAEGTGNCLAGHDNGNCVRPQNDSSTGNNSTAVGGHHNRENAGCGRASNGSGQNNRGHRNGGHHGR